jgi:hypothetical protein
LWECNKSFHKVVSALRVELREGIVEQEEWWVASAVGE